MTDQLNIYQRLNKVREAVSYLQKDASVQGYRAITHDMVTSEVRPHFIQYGIMVVPKQTSGELRDTGKTTSKGTSVTVYVATYEIEFVNIDKPEDKVVVFIGAIAEDQNDKGPGKAVSYATKTAILKLLSIETGESDESRQEQKPSYITEKQTVDLDALAIEVSADMTKFLKYFKIDEIAHLKSSDYEKAVAMLEKKRGIM